MEVKNKLTQSYKRTTAIVSIGFIGAVMSILGLLETGRTATGKAITPEIPMARTAETASYIQQPEFITQTANTGLGIPIFNEVLPAFMYLGGIMLLLLAAYLDYTESETKNVTTTT